MTAVSTALIIGGGIAGPVAGLALRKAGIESTVYEAYETTADGTGGVLNVAPNGLGALRIIGADEAVRTIGQPTQRMVIADGSGKRLKPLAEFAGLPGLPPSQTMRRSELYRVLHDHAVAQGIRIEYGKRLVGVDDTPAGITARFADGSTASGDVLIGADGIRSTVRTLMDPDAPGPEYVGLVSFAGFAADSGVPGQPDAMYFVYGKRAFLGYGLLEGRMGWFSNLPRKEPMTLTEARKVPAADWLRLLREVYADDVPGRDLLQHTSADQLLVFGPMEIMPTVPRWHRGRMVLVGDSAHAPSPSSGQGASLAAESAIQLARCLRDLPDVPTAFAAYERLRRPRVQKIAARAAKVNNSKAPGRVTKALMGLLMPIAMKTFLTPEKMLGPEHGYRIDWDEKVTA
jgi:2-polyprenyl-6-methoxyphenol hydroxylase-like FAD-dependent oxidoreductase